MRLKKGLQVFVVALVLVLLLLLPGCSYVVIEQPQREYIGLVE